MMFHVVPSIVRRLVRSDLDEFELLAAPIGAHTRPPQAMPGG
jgi:hypothetical protein